MPGVRRQDRRRLTWATPCGSKSSGRAGSILHPGGRDQESKGGPETGAQPLSATAALPAPRHSGGGVGPPRPSPPEQSDPCTKEHEHA